MSLNEKVTRALAIRLSRRRFLKSLGAFVTGLGVAQDKHVAPANQIDYQSSLTASLSSH